MIVTYSPQLAHYTLYSAFYCWRGSEFMRHVAPDLRGVYSFWMVPGTIDPDQD